jgi:hypothetical protein
VYYLKVGTFSFDINQNNKEEIMKSIKKVIEESEEAETIEPMFWPFDEEPTHLDGSDYYIDFSEEPPYVMEGNRQIMPQTSPKRGKGDIIIKVREHFGILSCELFNTE